MTTTAAGIAPHSCRCGARWTGQRMAHCAADCHRTFTSVTAFDRHRHRREPAVTVHTGTNPATLRTLAGDIRQLVEPIHMAHRRQVLTHDPLLDQLRDACIPSSSTITETIRRRSRGSQPPASTTAVSTLAEIEVGVSFWRVKLDLPSPDRSLDWFKAVLGMLPDAAEGMASSLVEWLATDVHGWWTDAARAAGWRTDDLLKLR